MVAYDDRLWRLDARRPVEYILYPDALSVYAVYRWTVPVWRVGSACVCVCTSLSLRVACVGLVFGIQAVSLEVWNTVLLGFCLWAEP
jgi:hypothetical protein